MLGGDAPPTTAAPVVAPELIGRTLGKYVLLERLGKGGSGEVFRAEQAQLGRSVVVKVLRREVAATPNRVERFLREAKLASRLDHPYAAHIYAFGAEPDGVLWIAMEHVKGMTLDELVTRRGAIPATVFGPLFARLCEVVHSAHELGIIHRDIKGTNVMVIERAGQLLPKLLDFGIAKSGDGDVTPGVVNDDADGLTGHGVTLGSPHYMSPEQWERPSEVDARADIYALGVLAYRCISGRLPFQGHDRAKLGDAHTTSPPPALPPGVPRGVGDAILRALAKQPDARWSTAIAFADAVRIAAGTNAPETVPLFDPATRDAWLRAGPQPIADAIAHLTSATTTVEADAALREVVAIACRWLAVLALSGVETTVDPKVREHARGVIGRDDGAPWLRLARAAALATKQPLPGLVAAIGGGDRLAALAERLDDRDQPRNAAALAADVFAIADALHPLESLLAYELVVGRTDGSAESWQGPRRRDRERRIVWGELAEGEVALLDAAGTVVARLSPLAQVIAPLPSAEPELFLLWRGGRGPARLVAAPWGFERDDEAAGSRLAALSTEDSDTSADPADDRSPYPGLAAYGVGDADHFVGREREVEVLANRLVRTPLVAVLGPSGVGKSSFIHAGVMPRLGEHHRILTMRPGRHPLHALAALPAVSGDIHDPPAIATRLRELGDSAQRGLVLVVDQLEELVTLCTDEAERRAFAETLAAAADGPGAPVRVVATLRDDFATVIEAEAAFRGRFEVFVLATPPPEALRRIVTEPARRMAVSVDARVVDDMVAEVAGRPASLPLLSFTGSQLWQSRDRAARKITYGAYLELGGVAGALATYADQVYADLARRDQDTVRDLFARLVAADGTRVPSPRAELEELPGAKAVLSHLVDARLLVVRDEGGRDVVEVIHECLAERWPRLARWRSEDAADRALLGDLRVAARRWQESKRGPDLLWRGQALAELRRLSTHSTVLTELERGFADASDRADRRARRVRRGLVAAAMVVLATIAAVMIFLSLAANDSRHAAEASASSARDSAKLAEDRLTTSLIAQGRRELNDGRALQALAYFGEALRRGADSVALREMIAIATRSWRYEKRVIRAGKFTALAVTPTAIIAGDTSGTLHWYGTDTRNAGELATDLGDIMQIRPRGDRLVVSGNTALAIVDANRKIIAHITPASAAFAADLGPGPDEITTVERDAVAVYGLDGKPRRKIALDAMETGWTPAFSRGRFVAIGGQNQLSIFDRVAMTRRTLDTGGFTSPAASDDGSVVVFLDKDHAIHLLDADGHSKRTVSGQNDAVGLVVSPTGDRFAAYGARTAIVYDTATFEKLHQFAIDGDQQLTTAIRGDDVWFGAIDGVIRHYHAGVLVASLPVMAGQIQELQLAGDTVAAISNDSSLVMLDASAAQLVLARDQPCGDKIEPQSNGIGMVALCQDGNQIVYVGLRKLGENHDNSMGFITVDPKSHRAALTGEGITVVDPDGVVLAKATKDDPGGALAFADPDHLLVLALAKGKGLSRWAFATNHWDHLADITDATAIGVATGGTFIGFLDGHVALLRDGREVHRIALGDRVDFLTPSDDGRWIAVQLASGGTIILDGTTGDPVRTFATADSVGTASTLDPTGELVLRPSRGQLTLWERATGDELVWNLDLMKLAIVARVDADGRIELDGYKIGLLDLPRDARPATQLLHDIDCRVPFKIVAGRLEPSTGCEK